MSNNITEKHKKPVENDFEMQSHDLARGVGLLTYGLFAFGTALGFYNTAAQSHPLCAGVGAGLGLGLAIGMAIFALPKLARVKAFGEKVLASSKEELRESWKAAKFNIGVFGMTVPPCLFAVGHSLGNSLGRSLATHSMPHFQVPGGDVTMFAAICVTGLLPMLHLGSGLDRVKGIHSEIGNKGPAP